MPEIVAENRANLTPIQNFYSGSNIFITGGTGFLGKILLEKLLRTCSDLSTIYVLVRNKKGKDLHTRIDELFDDVIFSRLKQECPKFRHQVVGVSGDCGLPDLGLSDQDRQMLINEVNVIFHVAATVKFDEKLKLAVAINVRSVHDLIGLARHMTHLKAMMHVSTAFSNVPQKVIEEKFYQTPIDSKKLMLLTETMNDKNLEKITPAILDEWPNTYAFTKAIAEDVIRQEGHGIPIALFRPAIVVSTYKEPLKAWINNLYGPTGVVAGAGSGLLRALHADSKVNANIVPVDMCVNALISAAWEVGTTFENTKEVPVYHFESSTEQPVNWGTFMQLSQFYGTQVPTVKAIWYYSFDIYKNYYLYTLVTLFLHFLPALFIDGALLCMGKQPTMLKIYKKVHKFTHVLSYFSTRTFVFKSERVRNMINNMTDEDRELFFCDLKQLDWEEFFTTYCRGIRIYLMQDPLDTLQVAQSRWKKLYWCHQAVKTLGLFILLRFLWAIFSFVYSFML